jgi:thymidylate synthase (FAD)
VSRSFTHELVRHRAGFGFSQVSQRYVDGAKLRFVCRPEWQGDEELMDDFFHAIEDATDKYEATAAKLMIRQQTQMDLLEKAGIKPEEVGLSKTDLRKAVNQAARARLPNETEAPVVVTANVRAWRHFLNMRGSLFAEPEARGVGVGLATLFQKIAPVMFQDVVVETHPYRGPFVKLQYPKV